MKIFNYYVYFDIINSCNNRGVATNNGLGGEGGGAGSNRDLFCIVCKYERDIKESNVSSSC